MAFPTVDVSVAFTSDPLDTPSWTSVKTYTRAVRTKVGRDQNADAFQPGKATVTLDNSQRRFDPMHAGGAYYGNLKPNKRLRVQATWDGVTYDVFTGFVDGWPVEYGGPAEATSTVTATDATKYLTRTINADPFGEVMQSSTLPSLWWRFNEKGGTQVVDSSGNDRHGTAQADLAGTTAEPLTLTGGGQSHSLRLGAEVFLDAHKWGGITGTGDFSVSFWFRGTPPDSIATLLCSQSDGTTWWRVICINNSPNIAFVFNVGTLASARDVQTEYNVALDGKPHFFTCMRYSGALYFFVDGVDHSYDRTGSATTSLPAGEIFIGPAFSSPEPAFESWAIDEFAVWPWAIGPLIADLYAAGSAPWNGDLTGARVERILDLTEIPAALRNIDDGQSTLGPAAFQPDTNVQAELDLIATTEQGAIYCDPADGGKVRFRDRATPLTATVSTTSQATFSDDSADTSAVRYSDIKLRYDDQLVVNRVVVNWAGGASVAEDATSIVDYGPQTKTLDTLITDKAQADNLAAWILDHNKDVFLRVEAITVVPSGMSGATQTAAGTQCLAREIGDRITVRYLPQNVGSAIEVDVLIEGIEHEFSDGIGRWATTFACTPAEIASYWILGTSQLDTDTRLAY